jgi:hypothetical protein
MVHFFTKKGNDKVKVKLKQGPKSSRKEIDVPSISDWDFQDFFRATWSNLLKYSGLLFTKVSMVSVVHGIVVHAFLQWRLEKGYEGKLLSKR